MSLITFATHFSGSPTPIKISTSITQSIFAVAALCWIALFPHSALAAESPDEIRVVGSRMSAPEASPGRHVITRSEIEQINPGTTIDLLRALPGVTVFQSAGNNRLSFLAIRGGETNFTLVLVDGIEVNDPTNSRGGGFDFSQLDVNIIDRVSVFTGDVSAIYGGSAMNGVVSITTLGTDYSGLTLQAGTDSFYRSQLTGSYQGDSQSGLISIGASDSGDALPGSSENLQALAKHQLTLANGELSSLFMYSETESAALGKTVAARSSR